ncbi:MAG: RidA family protein [Actinomycetia bacterium]|nr:RidA family protein [Actinomycetes bacterium]
MSKHKNKNLSAVEMRLSAAGYALPDSAPPIANYQAAVRHGNQVVTAGQLPMAAGSLLHTGLVGVDLDAEQARACVRQATLNALSAVRTCVDLADVKQTIRLVGYLACPATFTEHPEILNAGSDLLFTAFGEHGNHVRSAVGVSSLPLGSPVEIELVVGV